MKLRNIFTLFATVAMFALVGCEENKGEGGQAVFKLDTTEISVDAEGGAQEVKYEITNPKSGAVVLSNCSESWIKELSTATYGSITFTVAPNYKQEAREAKITVSYTAVEEEFEIVVKQAASDKPLFAIEVVENKPTYLSLNITPADLATAYICRIYTEEHIKTFELEEDAALIEYDLQTIANEAYSAGQTTFNYLQNISYKGKSFDVVFDKLIPDTNYVVYCYHIDLSNAQASTGDVIRQVIRTASPDMVNDALEMSLDINGATITQNITTKEAGTYFYTEHWSVNDFKIYFVGDAQPETTFVDRWNQQTSMWLNMGYYPSQIIEEWCLQGSQSIVCNDLEAETDYYFYAFAIDPETAFVASPTLCRRPFRTFCLP